MDALWWLLLFVGSAWGIYTPGSGGVKKPQVSAGIDTSTWKASTTPKDVVVVYDRYSSVKMQQHSNAENLEGVYRDNRAGKYVSQASWNMQVTSERPLEQKHYFTVSSHGKQRWQNYYSGRVQDVGRDLVAYSTCPSGQTGQFVYDLACNQYLNCYKGRGYRQNCAPGTLFNPKTLECDYADKVECISGPKKAQLKVDGGVSARQQQVSCPRGFSGIIPNYGDCSKFISCANGKENVMDCPPGTLFDVKSNMCDFPQKCDCVNGENEKHRAANQFVASYYSKSEAGRYATDHHTTGQTDEFGATHSATGQYATASHSLKQYPVGQHPTGGYETVYTSRYYQKPSGQYHTGQSTEDTYLAGQSSITHQSGLTSGHTQTGYHGSHGVGQNYTRLEKVILAPTQSAKCPSGYTGLHPHPYDCAKFLNCANGGTVVQDCGPGTHFSPILKVCDFPYKVNCNLNRGTSQNYVDVASKTYDHKQQWSNGAEWHVHNRTGHSPQWQGENCSHSWHNHQRGHTNQQSNSNSFTENGYNQWHQHTGNQWPQKHSTTDENYEVPRINSSYDQNYYNSNWHQWHQEVPQRNSTTNYHSSDRHQWHQEVPQRNSTPSQNHYSSGWHQWHQEVPQRNSTYDQNYHSSDWHQWHQTVPQQNSTSDRNYHSSDWHQWHQPPNNPEQPTSAQGNPTTGQDNYGSDWHRTTFASNTSGPQQWHRPSTNQWRPTFPRRNSTTDHNYHSYPVHNHTSHWHKHHYVPPKSYTTDQKQYIPPLPPPPTPIDEDAQTFELQQTIDTHDQATTRPKWSRPDGDVGRDLSTASTTNKHWPPPFPSTDLNADYVFEYDDLDVSLEADNNKLNGGSKKVIDWCDAKGFECGNKFCISPSQVCDQTQDCPNGKDEERCSSAMWEFAITSGSKLAVREIDKILNITLPWCAKLCYEDKSNNCKSFNYRKMDGACFLLSTNVGHSGVLMRLPNYDYYEHKKFSVDCSQGYLCSSMKCLSRAQICDGVNDCGDGTDEKGCKAEAFGYSIALGGTGKKHVGRIEIQAFGKFGYVCDDMFGLRNADVVCRELGFTLGALEVKGNSFYASDVRENDTFYMMDDVICLGNETSLRDCSFSGWGVHNCQPQEIVGVVCKTPVEVCPQGHWKCRSGKECLPLAFVCDGVYDCTDKTDENPDLCESPLEFRLVNGTSKKEGRVEVRYHGIWGTICDDDFNDDAAKVVCSHFGYHGPAKVKKDAHFGAGSGPIWLDQVYCKGNETTVGDCEHWHWGEHNCEHSEDVGVVCGDSQAPGSPRHSSNSLDSEESSEDDYDATLPKECGLRSDAIFRENSDVHFRVVQGSLAKRGEYPWQASIRIQGKTKQSHWCGAIVVSQKYVLTAAHCLGGYSKGAYFITAGDYDIDEDEGTEQNAYIEDFIIHQQYKMGNKMNNDIAVVKLKGKGFKFTKAVQPICIPEVDLLIERNTNCTISGFGSIESGKSKTSHTLRAGWIPIQPVEVCKMPHVYGTAITDGMLCAGSLDEGIDACDGDSGGPLACLHEGLFTLFGITSWGQHCGLANRPGVYVKVSHYRQWIEETMQKLAEK